MDEYYRTDFPVHLQSLRFARPNPVVLDRIMRDLDAMFFGGRGWKNCASDLSFVPERDRAKFVLCLFMLVLMDRNMHANFRTHHEAFRRLRRVPKFGWSGYGPHNENPFLLMVVPLREGLVPEVELNALAPQSMALFVTEVTRVLSGIPEVTKEEFFRKLCADRGFARFADQPPVPVVIAALNVALACNGIGSPPDIASSGQ